MRFRAGGAARRLTFAAMLAGFQVYYWFLHRALHTALWFASTAGTTTGPQVTTPLTGQSVSFVESLRWVAGYVGLPVAVLALRAGGLLGLAGYGRST